MQTSASSRSGLTRRHMLAASAALLAKSATAQPSAERKLTVSIFSKHLQFLEGDELARAAAEIGFDGVDLTVRRGGHVEPERVAEDLPPLVELLRKHGLAAQMVTSGIVDAESPHAEAVLKTLAGLGIRYYRWGGFRYQPEGSLLQQLEALKPRIEKLAALNARYKLCAMYHTHSGVGQVGASIWDMHLLLKDFDPDAVAVNYDVGHATIEGGLGDWINSFRITGPYLKGIAVKDFVWAKGERGWNVQWRPLGEGMVRFPQFFELVKQSGFDGPLQLHYEYALGGAETGKKTLTISREEALSAMKRDLTRLCGWLKDAGLS